ncbi:MAG TPA: TonB-dependent receptor [Steroidobacteraceae bacterium]
MPLDDHVPANAKHHKNVRRHERKTGEPMSKFVQHSLLVPLSCTAILVFMPIDHAMAEEPAPNTNSFPGLEEIVVTARKREESLQSTPMAMTALSANTLERQQINTTQDLSRVVPSLLINPSGGIAGTNQMFLRGFGELTPTNLLSDTPVAQYLDGVVIARAMGNVFSLVDMERVEVEAGPQGTLFGRNVTGGAISFITKPPAGVFGVEEKVIYGSYNDLLTRTTVDTGELGSTGFYAKLAYMHHTSDGYVHNALAPSRSQDPGAVHADSVFLALHGNLTPTITVDYKFDDDIENDQPTYPQAVIGTPAFAALQYASSHNFGGSPRPILGTSGPLFNGAPLVYIQPSYQSDISLAWAHPSPVHASGHNLTLKWDVSDDIQVKSITGYRDMLNNSADNFGGDTGTVNGISVLQPVTPSFGLGPVTSLPTLVTPGNDASQHQFSEELQLNGKFNRLNYVLGLYYFDEHVRELSLGTQLTVPILVPQLQGLMPNTPYGPTPFGFPAGYTADQDYTGQSKSRAGYLSVNYSPPILDDKLELSGGLRYTADTKRLDQNIILPPGSVPGCTGTTGCPSPTDVVQTKDWHNVSASGSIMYQWTPDVMTYFRIGDAYRAGGFNPSGTEATAAGFTYVNSYNPESVVSYEAGLKSDWLDRRVRFNADIYFTDYTNQQVSQFGANPAGGLALFVVNAGRATYKGFEAQLTFLPAAGWQFDASVGEIIPRYLTFQPLQNGPNQADLAYFAFLPRTTLSGDLQYSFDQTSIGRPTIRADVSFKSRVYFTTLSPYTTPAAPYADLGSAPPFTNLGVEITLADIPIKVRGVTLDAEVFGKNLLGHHDVYSMSDLISSLGFASETWGPGSTVGVQLVGRFK